MKSQIFPKSSFIVRMLHLELDFKSANLKATLSEVILVVKVIFFDKSENF